MKIPQFLLGLATSAFTNEQSQHGVAPALWDGKCFYPQADPNFNLETYPGRWYQLAGTLARFTAGCKCISARYDVNVSARLVASDKKLVLTSYRMTEACTLIIHASAATHRRISKAMLSLQTPRTARWASFASVSLDSPLCPAMVRIT